MGKKKYRSANIIIQTILEHILRSSENQNPFEAGIVKTQLIKLCGLKHSTADQYLKKMENAGYIDKIEDTWGDRDIIRYSITEKGKERYKWFVLINTELKT